MHVTCPHCGDIRDTTGIPPDTVVYCACGKAFRTPPAIASGVPIEPASVAVDARETSGLAVVSLILGCASFLTCGALVSIPGLIVGYRARREIRENPGRFKSAGIAQAGVIVNWVNIAFSAIVFAGIFASIAIPNFVAYRSKAYDVSAKVAGANARIAQEARRENQEGGYSGNLAELLAINATLTDDPAVTFEFLHASATGFVFTTKHAEGETVHTFTND
ncbi:DUF4190 domain-containing protein [bacterium]|nr:DUF4190 domain-containing protein [bacterium]